MISRWVSRLAEHVSSAGFKFLSSARFKEDNFTRKLETDDHLMVLEDQLPRIADLLALKEGVPVVESRRRLEDLWDQVLDETKRGVSLTMVWYTGLARVSKYSGRLRRRA